MFRYNRKSQIQDGDSKPVNTIVSAYRQDTNEIQTAIHNISGSSTAMGTEAISDNQPGRTGSVNYKMAS